MSRSRTCLNEWGIYEQGSMTPSARAILGRFKSVTEAVDYCETMARTYGHLTHEYRSYREEIINHA